LVHPDDPEGPLDLDVGSVQVWIDDRITTNNNNNSGITAPGIATLSGDPTLPEPDSLRATGWFDQLEPNADFIIQTNVYEGFPLLILANHQVLDGKMRMAMGVIYRTMRSREIGGFTRANADTLVLKVIRPSHDMGGTSTLDLTQGIFAETRRLELRNVYDLGINLLREERQLDIRWRGILNGIANPDRIGDATFLSITGLDLFTNNGEGQMLHPPPDGRVDPGRVDVESTYLRFRELQPFAPTREDIARRFVHERPDTLSGDLTVPGIYLRNDWESGDDPDLVSRYRFVLTVPILRTD
jgi:hypothetical protein